MNIITKETIGFDNPTKADLIYLVVHPFSNRSSALDALNFPNSPCLPINENNYLNKIVSLLTNSQNPLIITQPDWYLPETARRLHSIPSDTSSYLIETAGDVFDGDIPEPKIGWEKFAEFLSLFKSPRIILCGAQLGIEKGILSEKYKFCVGETYNQLKNRIKGISLDKYLCLIYN